jgi:hypothetical protein
MQDDASTEESESTSSGSPKQSEGHSPENKDPIETSNNVSTEPINKALAEESAKNNPSHTETSTDKNISLPSSEKDTSKRKFEEEDNGESSSSANKKQFKQDSSDIVDDFSEMPPF